MTENPTSSRGKDVYQQIDLLFSRLEQERKDRIREDQDLRRLIPLTDLKERGQLQSEVVRLTAVVNALVTQVSLLSLVVENKVEADDEEQRLKLWEGSVPREIPTETVNGAENE